MLAWQFRKTHMNHHAQDIDDCPGCKYRGFLKEYWPSKNIVFNQRKLDNAAQCMRDHMVRHSGDADFGTGHQDPEEAYSKVVAWFKDYLNINK